MRWNAIVLAGSRPGVDAFAASFGTDLKALIPVAGEPMVRRPVRALLDCEDIARVTVLAQQPDRIAAVLPDDERLSVKASQGTIAETLLQLCEDPDTQWPLLVTTADHALLSPAIVHEACWRSMRSDVGIGVVSKRRLTAAFPGSRRTWLRFKGGAFTGANLFILRSERVAPAIQLWRSIEQDRKNVMRVFWSLGPAMFLKIVLRRLTIEDALHQISVRIGVSVRPVRLSDPRAAIDVDKASDHAQVEAILAADA